MPRLSLNLHLKLLLPVLLGAVPALFVMVLLGKAYYEEGIRQTEQTLLVQAERLAERQQAAIDLTKHLLVTLASRPVLQSMRNPDCETLLGEIYQPLQKIVANLLVLRPDGQVACNAKAPGKHHDLSDRLYYQRAMATGAFAVGEYMIGRTTGTPVLGMAYPLVRDGQVVMLTATSIELGALNDNARLELHGQPSHLTIIDRQGHILLRSREDGGAHPIGSNIAATPLGTRLLESGGAGTFQGPDLTGEPTLFAHVPLGPEGEPYAYLALGLPVQALSERYKGLEQAQFGGALLALVLGLSIAAWSISILLRQRLTSLIEAVRQIRKGNMDERAPPDRSGDELGELTTAFNDMADTLASQQGLLRHLAHHDALTGLPNRVLFAERTEHAIRRAARDHQHLALLFLDLDHFKNINDSLGHAMGDRLLQAVARRLREQLRDEDTLARMGGDEFTILLENAGQPHDVAHTAQRLLQALTPSFELEGNTLFVSSSIGIALYPQDGEDLSLLMQRADAALYRSKAEGRNAFHFFSAEMAEAAAERLHIESGLRRALEHGELELHYQPQIDLERGEVIGMEALARWHHPERGWIPPARFIPVAEESGLIVRLGQWALREACLQLKRWQAAGLAVGYVAVNVSTVQFRHGTLVEDVRQAIESSGIAAGQLELEITESFILHDPEAATRILKALRDLGVRLAIDDFGTGYSSLLYLKRLPLDRIKIDQGFVRDMLTDPQDEAIVRAVIALGHSLELDVLAEGVETAEHASRLRELGCHAAQGYHFGRPAPASQHD